MRGAVSVRINDGTNDRTVTGRVSGLKFSKQADGGHKAASFRLVVPVGTFTDLGPSDKVYIYDGRSGVCLWEGYTDAPTPTVGPNGESYEVSALGGMIRAADETRALIYIDNDTTQWEKDSTSVASAGFETNEWQYDPAYKKIRVQFNPGSPIADGEGAAAGNYSMERAGMSLGGVRLYDILSGKTDGTYRVRFVTSEGVTINLGNPDAMSAIDYPDGQLYAGTHFPSGSTTRFALRLHRFGPATNVADEQTYTDFVGVSVLGQRVDRYGALLTASSGLGSLISVGARQVVEDLLGRLLDFCDPVTSWVDPTPGYAISQFAYFDGTTAQAVLDDLSNYEPDYLWEILHSTEGGHVFNYRRWPTAARYEISTRDGYLESGSDVDLCNRIAVMWNDPAGLPQATVVTATSDQYPALQALEQAGRIRDADPVTLPDGQGSLANAQALGATILGDAAGQPTPARAVVRRRIHDLQTGCMVDPWEIETGHVVRVRETGREHRLTEMEYDDDSCASSLTLGYPSPTRDQRIAQLA